MKYAGVILFAANFAACAMAEDSLQEMFDSAASSPEKTLKLEAKRYFLDSPIKLGPRHSGLKVAGKSGAAISSLKKIKNWEADGKFWKAKIPGADFVSSIFVNGRRASIATTPNEGARFFVFRGTSPRRGDNRKTFIVRSEDIAELKNLSSGELKNAYFQIYRAWIDNRGTISDIRPMRDGKTCAVTFATPLSPHIYGGSYSMPRFKLANFKGALDTPGEFFFDKSAQTLWYCPREGEDIKTAEIFYPVSDVLLEICGDANAGIAENISFENVAFEGSSNLPDSKIGGWENSSQAAVGMPSAITVSKAKNIKFEGCSFKRLDGYALEFYQNATFCGVENCVFSDLGAGAVKIGSKYKPENAPVSNITVKNNIIYKYGRIDRSAVGVLVFDSGGNTISHNEIFDGYYTGISVGWTWGFTPSHTQNNTIDFNKIHNLSFAQMCDLGGIYTLGISHGSKISNNLIFDIDCHQYGGWGIYNDEGSTGFIVSGNFVRNAQEGGYYMHYGKDCEIRNNVFCESRDFQLGLGRNMPDSLVFERNVVAYNSPAKLFRENRPPSISAAKFDNNIYWNASGEVLFGKYSFAEWRESGRDSHSFIEKVDLNSIFNGGGIEKIGFKPIGARFAGPEGKMGETAKKILENYKYPQIVRHPVIADWNNGAFDDFSVGEIGKPPVYMNVDTKGGTAKVVADENSPAGRALEIEGKAEVSQYCRFTGGKELEFSIMFKLSEGSEFSCGTQNATFFSVKDGQVNGNESEKLPMEKWLTAKGKMNFPLKGGEAWTLSLSDGNKNYKCDMQLPKNAGGKPARFALKSLGGQTRFADLKMDVIE